MRQSEHRMNQDVTILVAEDDEGHAGLIRKNLGRAGITNPIIHFKDGQEIIDFLFCTKDNSACIDPNGAYVLLLDIRMPKLDGTEVLRRMKESTGLRTIPVIMITTTDDPREVEHCHALGCNSYITKPVEYDEFVNAIRQLGLYLSVVQVPALHGNGSA